MKPIRFTCRAVLPLAPEDIAGQILSGGARLYGFGEADFAKADKAAKRHDNIAAARA